MTNTRIVSSLIIASALVVPLGASAQSQSDRESGARGYVGGGLGYFRLDDEDFLDQNDDLRENRSAWQVFAGFEANRVFSMEVGYNDFGTTEDGDMSLEATGTSIAAMAAIPVSPVFAPYGRIGHLDWDRTRSVGPLSQSDDGSDMFYGVGIRTALTDSADLRFQYDRMTLDETDLDMGSINLQVRF